MLFMGIDGGGSNLRVVITDENLNIVAVAYHSSANPNLIGRDEATHRIQSTMKEALSNVDEAIVAVGIGIAGAPKTIAESWLRTLVADVLPDVHIVPASDNEIALVGALGRREGILLLAGTGSGGFGINSDGDSLQVGGWGYLLGDEGSGYWLGLQAIKHLIHHIDTQQPPSFLATYIMDEHRLKTMGAIIDWVYHQDGLPVPRIARLAPLVLDAAKTGDNIALEIIEVGADYFCDVVETLKRRLQIKSPEIGFAGSLLTTDNLHRETLISRLGLSKPPKSLYDPHIGASLLAKLDYDTQGILS